MYKIRLALNVGLFCLLSACGHKSDSPVSSSFLQDPFLPIATNVQRAKLWCASSSDCPENIGYIISIRNIRGNKGEIHQCTGFLVAPGIVATNSHCIPDEVKADANKCPIHLGIKFPKTANRAEESHICEKLLFASQIVAEHGTEGYLANPDFAFFSIKTPSTRQPFQFTRQGISDNEELTAFTVNPTSEYEARGELKKKSCVAIKGSSLITGDSHPLSDIALVFGSQCKMIGGNSGSPIIARDGRVAGLLFATVVEEQEFRDALPSHLLLGKVEIPSYVTNVACLKEIPAEIANLEAPPPMCEPSAKQKNEQLALASRESQLSEKLGATIEAKFREWVKTAPTLFKYSASTHITGGNYEAFENGRDRDFYMLTKIHCLKPVNQWENGYRSSRNDRNTPEASIWLPTEVTAKPKFDAYLRLRPIAEIRSDIRTQVSFDLRKVETNTQPAGILGNRSFNLRFCTPDELAKPDQFTIER